MATYYIGAQAFGINSFAHANRMYDGKPVRYKDKYYKNGRWVYDYGDLYNKGDVNGRRGRVDVRSTGYRQVQPVSQSPSHRAVGRGTSSTNTRVGTRQPVSASPSRSATASNSQRPGVMSYQPQPHRQSYSTYSDNNGRTASPEGIHNVAQDPISRIIQQGRRAIENGRNWIESMFNRAVDAARNAAQNVGRLAEKAWGEIKRAAGPAIERGKKFISDIVGGAREFVTGNNARAKTEALTRGAGMDREQARRASGYSNTLPGMVENVRNLVERGATGAARSVSSEASAAADAITQAVRSNGGRVLGFVRGLTGPMAVVEMNGTSTYVPISANEFEINGVRITVPNDRVGTK